MNEIKKLSQKEIDEINKPEKLQLKCRKCNHKWTEIRPKAHHVRYDNKGVFLVKHKSSEKIYFKCPKCEEQRDIGRLRHLRKGQAPKLLILPEPEVTDGRRKRKKDKRRAGKTTRRSPTTR